MTLLTSKQFNTKLSGVIRSAKSNREAIQVLLEQGFLQYQEHENTIYLTNLLNACVGVRSLPTRTIQKYVEEHANVVYTKRKEGQETVYRFKKVEKGADVVVKQPEVKWYEWSNEHQAKPTIDYKKRICNDVKKGLESGLSTQDVLSSVFEAGISIDEVLSLLNAQEDKEAA